MKHPAKMTEWRERIHDYRSSGQPVRTWYEENKVNEETYYRRERLYMAETSTGVGMADIGVITVRHGSTSVELPTGVPMMQIAALIKALCLTSAGYGIITSLTAIRTCTSK